MEFEEIKLDQTVQDEAELNNAILSVKRNGVALKGRFMLGQLRYIGSLSINMIKI